MDEKAKEEVEEEVTIKLPRTLLEFADFYAALGNDERNALLTKILIDRLKDIKSQVNALPHLNIPELY